MEEETKTAVLDLGFYWGYIGIMEKKMEATGIIGLYRGIILRGHVGIMEKWKLLEALGSNTPTSRFWSRVLGSGFRFSSVTNFGKFWTTA